MRTVTLPESPICFIVGEDLDSLVRAALRLSQATHFVACGHSDLRKWFHPAARTSETPVIDVTEFTDPVGRDKATVACALDQISRRSVEGFVAKASRMGCAGFARWPGAKLWHWWLCSDEQMLIWFDDWPWQVYVDPSLADWAAQMVAERLLDYREDETPA